MHILSRSYIAPAGRSQFAGICGAWRIKARKTAAIIVGFTVAMSLLACQMAPPAASTVLAAKDISGDISGIEAKDLAPEPASAIGIGEVGKSAIGDRAMVVTANPLATAAAVKALQQGGTAIDAAIAAQLVLGLVEPQSSGLGGGGFLMHWDAKQQSLHSYDGRETAPLDADESLFLNPDNTPVGFFEAVIGGRSVGVPSLVKMLETAHTDGGKLPWSALFDDAIKLAEGGFAISERMHTMIKWVPKLKERPEIRAYLFDASGEPKAAGTVLKNEAYATTLRQLASEGSPALYSGELAQNIIQAVNRDQNPGLLDMDDLQQYQVKRRAPVCKAVFDHTICGMGPPSSGAVMVLSMLGMLEQLAQGDAVAQSTTASVADDVALAHRFIEVSRLAFADRNRYLADADFVDVPVEQLLDTEYLRRRVDGIDPDRAATEVRAGEVQLASAASYVAGINWELPSTTHLSIVDAFGNAVSMTTSIETAFGSRLMAGGFILNNQLTDFSFAPVGVDGARVANRVEGGKRPLSSMSPMMVFDKEDRLVMVIGSPGGKKIISYVARVLYEVLALGLPLQSSVDAKHVVLGRTAVELEKGVSEQLLLALEEKGHTIKMKAQTSGIHAILKSNDQWLGVADARREGLAQSP